MTDWEQYDFESKLIHLLSAQRFRLKESHHFAGRPFVSVYQLAADFAREYPKVMQALDKHVGGEPSGGQDSLARYLALELSRQIKANPGYPIEGAWLAAAGLGNLHFMLEDDMRQGSPNTKYNGFTMFRLREGVGF